MRLGDNLEQQAIDAISQAQSSIDLAVMEFRLPLVAKALVAKQKAGVKVRLIIDSQYNKTLADYTSAEIARMKRHDRRAYEELKRYPIDALCTFQRYLSVFHSSCQKISANNAFSDVVDVCQKILRFKT